ncbi:MAG TPA: hypothetical protein VMM76_00445 [Pirellulaceae bacterium]|nr:hypothetical protein [Pirellulaceae bacterium]
MAQLDEDALALVRDHGLKEKVVSDIRARFSSGENLAHLLRAKIDEDKLTGMQARLTLVAALRISAHEFQVFSLWRQGILSDDQFDQMIRFAVAEQSGK